MKCFNSKIKNSIQCNKKKCRYWINHSESNNCCIILSQKEDSMILEKIGKIFGVTRMRICQIEKNALNKIKSIVNKN